MQVQANTFIILLRTSLGQIPKGGWQRKYKEVHIGFPSFA